MWPHGPAVVPALVPILIALAVMALTLNRWWRGAALLMLVLGGAAHYRSWEDAAVPRHLLEAIASKPGLHQVRGVVCSDPDPLPFDDYYDKKITHRAVFRLDVREIRKGRRWYPTAGKARVTLKARGAPGLEYGDYIWLEGKFYRPFPPTNPGQFHYRWYLERGGIYLGCSAKGETSFAVLYGHAGNRMIEAALRLKRSMARNIEIGIPETDASRLLAAVLLGYREGISRQLEESFRRTNTVHILAISGLHVGLIYLLIRSVLKLFPLSGRAVSLIAIPPLLFYMVLTGLKVPVLRATCMLTVYLLAPFFSRKADLFNTVGFAAFVILLAGPAQLFDAGFQLSFAAVISIIIFTPPLESSLFRVFGLDEAPGGLYTGPLRGYPARIGRVVATSVGVSLAAGIGLLPLIACYFNIFSPITVVANIAVAFFLTAAIGIGFLSAALGFLWGCLSLCLNGLNYWIMEAMIGWVRFLSRMPYAYFYVRPPPPLLTGCYYAVLLMIVFRKRLRSSVIVIGLSAAILIAAVLCAPCGGGGDLSIAFLDVGQGDSAFLQLPNGATMLIDGGPRTNFDSGRFVILPFLRSLGVRRLDVVVATHADMDHIGGLITVVEEMEVGRLILPRTGHTTWTHRRLLEAVGERGVPLHFGRRHDTIDLCPGVSIDILHPTAAWVEKDDASENDMSVVIRIAYGATSALFAGDIGSAAEEELVMNVAGIGSDILKVSHHGAKSGTGKSFLAAVRPRVSVISAGRNNRYGHPAPEVLERLRSMGAAAYRTDRDGAVFLRSDGRSWACSVFCRERRS